MQFWGGLAFGLVVGWASYFVLRRIQPKSLSDLSVFIGIIGGGTITSLFDAKGDTFAGYAIGLAVGFFLYFITFLLILGRMDIHDSLEKDSKEHKIMSEFPFPDEKK
jgi:NhaP-type Na+/H+ or K+/H+ antiporter